MTIIISKNGKNAKKVESSSFKDEDQLQQYIYQNPDSIPLYDIKQGVRVLIVSREFPTKSGPIDALGIDKEGDIYVIETKLYKNPDKRTVVAQVLDYGSSLWKRFNDFNEFLRITNESVSAKFDMTLNDKLKEYFNLDDEGVSSLLDAVSQNLDEGNLKFVVLMDKVEDRLKDLILFINENSKFDVYGVELEYYKHENMEILIPKIHGTEVKKSVAVSSPKKERWTWETFKKRLDDFGEEEVTVANQFIEWFKENGITIFWGTSKVGSFIPIFSTSENREFYPFSITGNAQVKWNAPHQGDKSPAPFDKPGKRIEILKRLQQIKGVTVDLENVNGYSALKLPLGTLANEKAIQHFFEVCLWIKKELVSG